MFLSALSLYFGHHVFGYVFVHVYVFLDLYINQPGSMLFPSAGQALPSHYSGSRTNHSLRLSVSTNLTLFSLLSLVIFFFHSLRQLPSPSCPQSALITFSSRMYSISLALLSISLSFPPSPICHTSLSSILLSPLILSGLHLADCTLFSFFLHS